MTPLKFSGVDINESGDVLNGWSTPELWRDGRYERLPEQPDDWVGIRTAINDYGQVVGSHWVRSLDSNDVDRPRATLWSGGTAIDLGTLGGEESVAHDINNAGQIVGEAYLADGPSHAFLYQDGVMTDLTPGDHWSEAVAINAAGDVVGRSDWNDDSTLFLYAHGSMIDLEELLPPAASWTVTEVFDINDAGQILARGWGPDGDSHGVILTPGTMDAPAPVTSMPTVVPEPSTLAMLGLLGAVRLARRACRKAAGRHEQAGR